MACERFTYRLAPRPLACAVQQRRGGMAGELTIDSGDTAWMLISTALVMMMLLPGLALF